MKKIRGDKPIGVIIHIYMEISQENSRVASFFSNKLKCHVFHFLFSFSFYKIREQEGGAGSAQGEWLTPVGDGERG
jgi:hypothetical protein